MALFAKTVEAGSFRAAATALGISASVVSHHVSQLEERLGVALLYRSTRRLSLTPAGKTLFGHAKEALAAAESGLNAIMRQAAEPVGELNLTLSAFFAHSTLLDDIAAFALAHPRVALSMRFSDTRLDLIHSGIDLALRIGALQDSSLKSRKLFDLERRLVVAADVFAARPRPRVPDDLLDWDWIGLSMRPNRKRLTHREGETRELEFTPRIVVDSIDAVSQLACAGLGLATPPAFLVDAALDSGRLVEPLPDWRIDSLGVYAVWPPNAPRESLTFRLLDFLTARERERRGEEPETPGAQLRQTPRI